MKKRFLALCLLVALVLSGCGKAQDTATPTDASALVSTSYAPMQQSDGS